jgi:hypothetical protein
MNPIPAEYPFTLIVCVENAITKQCKYYRKRMVLPVPPCNGMMLWISSELNDNVGYEIDHLSWYADERGLCVEVAAEHTDHNHLLDAGFVVTDHHYT